jgi:hypothetical protein
MALATYQVWNRSAARVIASSRLFAIGFLCAVVSAGSCGCVSPLERTPLDTAVSPDEQWTATIYWEVQDLGLGSDYRTIVELRGVGGKPGTRVLHPYGPWGHGKDLRLRWLGPRVLEVSVPNRTAFYPVVRDDDSIEIRVTYQNDDPEDRALWLRAVKEHEAWENRGRRRDVPEPVIPPPREQQ